MHALALELGSFCLPSEQFLTILSTRIASSIVTRGGKFVYQTVALSIEGFPYELAMQTFALATMDFTTPPGTTTWRVETMGQVQSVFGSIFEDGPDYCSGASKAFKTASEPVIRVIGTIMPGAVISHVDHSRGVAKLFINLNYILSDEDGELHPPKDINRLELLLSPEEVSELRSQVATDAYFMGEKGLPLSASWWRQIANEEQALMAEALLHNLSTAPAPAAGKRRRRADHYEVEQIMQEQRGWFLVRWAGYHPSWEAWRITGEVGSPVETWEQERVVRRTEAMTAWRG